MQYLLLIYDNEQHWATYSPDEAQQIMGEYRDLTQSIAQSGHYKGGNQLQPIASATTVEQLNDLIAATRLELDADAVAALDAASA